MRRHRPGARDQAGGATKRCRLRPCPRAERNTSPRGRRRAPPVMYNDFRHRRAADDPPASRVRRRRRGADRHPAFAGPPSPRVATTAHSQGQVGSGRARIEPAATVPHLAPHGADAQHFGELPAHADRPRHLGSTSPIAALSRSWSRTRRCSTSMASSSSTLRGTRTTRPMTARPSSTVSHRRGPGGHRRVQDRTASSSSSSRSPTTPAPDAPTTRGRRRDQTRR